MARLEHISQLLDAKVVDAEGQSLGRVSEVCVSTDEKLPCLLALQIISGKEQRWIGIEHVSLTPNLVKLRGNITKLEQTLPTENDYYLRRDLLDKQIVDVHDHRVVRVNDVWLAPFNQTWGIVGVEADMRSLARRIGSESFVKWLARVFHLRISARIIPWNDVEQLSTTGGGIKLKVPYTKIARLHPADIADIVEQLDPADRTKVITSLDIETAADTISEAEPEVQASIIENLDDEHGADILEEMEPDEAADILQDLSDERSEALLEEMEPDEADDVKQLLEFDEETAGGLMTTEFVSVASHFTAEQTIEEIRQIHPTAETIYYIYVIDDDGKLLGVLSLRDLIVSAPTTPVTEFLVKEVISVEADEHEDEVAKIMGKYNLLALPVVDSENKLIGIITVDDTVARLLPPERKRRQEKDRED